MRLGQLFSSPCAACATPHRQPWPATRRGCSTRSGAVLAAADTTASASDPTDRRTEDRTGGLDLGRLRQGALGRHDGNRNRTAALGRRRVARLRPDRRWPGDHGRVPRQADPRRRAAQSIVFVGQLLPQHREVRHEAIRVAGAGRVLRGRRMRPTTTTRRRSRSTASPRA